MEAIERDLAGLAPNEYFTYISAAIERGMEELHRLERNHPDHVHTIVLMPDGKNNPPDDVANPLTFEELSETYPNLIRSDPLSDKDLVEIGAYVFRFENPHPYRQLVVRYLDGRIEKGTPATWDIGSKGFGLLPRDALPGSTEEVSVLFSELKAVYFVRDFDGQIGKKLESPETQIRGTYMKITFPDGERLEGYTAQGYDPLSPRFYFFPADQTGNTISMVVERENLEDLEIIGESEADE